MPKMRRNCSYKVNSNATEQKLYRNEYVHDVLSLYPAPPF